MTYRKEQKAKIHPSHQLGKEESEDFKFEFRFEDKMYLQNLADKDERIEILTGERNMLKDELDRQREINKTIAHDIMKGSREGYKLLEKRLKLRIDKLREALNIIGYPPNEYDDPSDIAINALDEDSYLAGMDKEK